MRIPRLTPKLSDLEMCWQMLLTAVCKIGTSTKHVYFMLFFVLIQDSLDKRHSLKRATQRKRWKSAVNWNLRRSQAHFLAFESAIMETFRAATDVFDGSVPPSRCQHHFSIKYRSNFLYIGLQFVNHAQLTHQISNIYFLICWMWNSRTQRCYQNLNK